MKLVEITGHLIDPGKVSYVGPIMSGPAGTGFEAVVDGVKLFIPGSRQELLDAIESAQPEMTELEVTRCCPSWSRVPPYDELVKAMEAEVQEASDALAAHPQWPNISCADCCIVPACRNDPGCPKGPMVKEMRVEPTVFCRYWPQCPQRDESPVLGSICLVCAASGNREQYRQELEAKKAKERAAFSADDALAEVEP